MDVVAPRVVLASYRAAARWVVAEKSRKQTMRPWPALVRAFRREKRDRTGERHTLGGVTCFVTRCWRSGRRGTDREHGDDREGCRGPCGLACSTAFFNRAVDSNGKKTGNGDKEMVKVENSKTFPHHSPDSTQGCSKDSRASSLSSDSTLHRPTSYPNQDYLNSASQVPATGTAAGYPPMLTALREFMLAMLIHVSTVTQYCARVSCLRSAHSWSILRTVLNCGPCRTARTVLTLRLISVFRHMHHPLP